MLDDRSDDGLGGIVTRVLRPGWAASLSLLAVRLAAPGVPDLYQGTASFTYSLVDPDNRVEPDWDERRALVDAAEALDGPAAWTGDDVEATKAVVITRTLAMRRRRAAAFGLSGRLRPAGGHRFRGRSSVGIRPYGSTRHRSRADGGDARRDAITRGIVVGRHGGAAAHGLVAQRVDRRRRGRRRWREGSPRAVVRRLPRRHPRAHHPLTTSRAPSPHALSPHVSATVWVARLPRIAAQTGAVWGWNACVTVWVARPLRIAAQTGWWAASVDGEAGAPRAER